MTIDPRSARYGVLLLRLAVGVLFLAHAWPKLFVFGPAGVVRTFGNLGLPPALAYYEIAAETLAGLALVLGVWPRLVALALIPSLLGTIWFVHGSKGFFFSAQGGGWEFPAFWAAALLALALLGDGPFAILRTPGTAERPAAEDDPIAR
jgi:putative oxidoreductase